MKLSISKGTFAKIGVVAFAMLGLCALVWWEKGAIEQSRADLAATNDQIDAARKQVAKINELERDVIVQRELDAAVREILPSDQDVTNYVRTLQGFADKSHVQISSLKPKSGGREDKQNKLDFQRAGYELTFQGDAFQLLSFLDLIEQNPRFMSVNTFTLSSAKRPERARKGAEEAIELPQHEIRLEVETYVYKPKSDFKPVKIESYERKRDLLYDHIAEQLRGLQVQSYEYRGQRGRRDPWIDPRVPATTAPGDPIATGEQIRLVDELAKRAGELGQMFDVLETTQSPIERMRAQEALGPRFTQLKADALALRASGQLTYTPVLGRLKTDVDDVLLRLGALLNGQDSNGTERAALEEALSKMQMHADGGEYDEALAVYTQVQGAVQAARKDAKLADLVERLEALVHEAHTVIDFGKIALSIRGVVISEGRAPIAIINDKAVEVGDVLEGGLTIHAIHDDEIEFEFRGEVLGRPIGQ